MAITWKSQSMRALDSALSELVTDQGMDDVLVVLANIADKIGESRPASEAQCWHKLAQDILDAGELALSEYTND